MGRLMEKPGHNSAGLRLLASTELHDPHLVQFAWRTIAYRARAGFTGVIADRQSAVSTVQITVGGGTPYENRCGDHSDDVLSDARDA